MDARGEGGWGRSVFGVLRGWLTLGVLAVSLACGGTTGEAGDDPRPGHERPPGQGHDDDDDRDDDRDDDGDHDDDVDDGDDRNDDEDDGDDPGEDQTDGAITEGPGPWSTDPLTNLSAAFNLGAPQSIGLDEAMNLWLLHGDRIGVLTPGSTEPTWVSGIGQASQGFSADALAMGSTVICGGAPGRAYVGYWTYELDNVEIKGPHEEGYDPVRYLEFQKGDMDAVRLTADGSIELEEHLWRSAGTSGGDKVQYGIRNTNAWMYDEDRSVLSCLRVREGRDRGVLYIGTNHGVTRIEGLRYNSHRHAAWYEGNTLKAGYNYGLGIGQDGRVLIANDWYAGIIEPSPVLEEWDRDLGREGPSPWRFKGYNHVLNSEAEFDHWRGFEQTTSGDYFLGSLEYGLWHLTIINYSTTEWTRVSGLPTSSILALKATHDGSLYIGTRGAGLWRRAPDGTLSQVEGIAGSTVKELIYEPVLTPSMLMVLTDAGVFLIRGP